MTRFEYVMVVVAILLGLSLTQVLRGLGGVVRGRTGHAGLTAWLLVLFAQHLQLWWSMWDLTRVSEWTQSSFFIVVLVPCTLLAATDALAPTGLSSDADPAQHFDRVAASFYSLFLVFLATSVAWTWLVLDLELDHFLRVLEAVGALAAFMGLVWRRRKVHVLAALIYLVSLVVGQVIFRPFLQGG